MSLGPLFDQQQAQTLKEAGMDQAMENADDAFAERACALIQAVHGGDVVMAEEWRKTCVSHGVVPHHPNAWGALTATLRKRRIIEDTGKFQTALAMPTGYGGNCCELVTRASASDNTLACAMIQKYQARTPLLPRLVADHL